MHWAGSQEQQQLRISTVSRIGSISLIATQHEQQETLVHITSVLYVTRYATQVSRQHINLVMDTVERTHQDITMLYNITSSLYTSLNYQQIVLHICSMLANLRDSTLLHMTSHHACNGLYSCSHNWHTITSCTPSRSPEDVNAYQTGNTFNCTLTRFIRGYTSLL